MRMKADYTVAHSLTRTPTMSNRAEDQAQTTYSLYFVSIKIRSACCGKCLAYFLCYFACNNILNKQRNCIIWRFALRACNQRASVLFLHWLFSETMAIPHVIIVREMENDKHTLAHTLVIHIIIKHRNIFLWLNYKTANAVPREWDIKM